MKAQAQVKVGGRLVYSTCSILPYENEFVVDWFDDNFGASPRTTRRPMPRSEVLKKVISEHQLAKGKGKGIKGKGMLFDKLNALLPGSFADGRYDDNFTHPVIGGESTAASAAASIAQSLEAEFYDLKNDPEGPFNPDGHKFEPVLMFRQREDSEPLHYRTLYPDSRVSHDGFFMAVWKRVA